MPEEQLREALEERAAQGCSWLIVSCPERYGLERLEGWCPSCLISAALAAVPSDRRLSEEQQADVAAAREWVASSPSLASIREASTGFDSVCDLIEIVDDLTGNSTTGDDT